MDDAVALLSELAQTDTHIIIKYIYFLYLLTKNTYPSILNHLTTIFPTGLNLCCIFNGWGVFISSLMYISYVPVCPGIIQLSGILLYIINTEVPADVGRCFRNP